MTVVAAKRFRVRDLQILPCSARNILNSTCLRNVQCCVLLFSINLLVINAIRKLWAKKRTQNFKGVLNLAINNSTNIGT
jgi:hypothetical protein